MMKVSTLFFLLHYLLVGQTGYEIARQVYQKSNPEDLSNTMHMQLISTKNKIRSHVMKSKSIDGNRKQMIWFLEPKDDKGVSFLKIEHIGKDDEMKMWLPAFKKIRRITSKKKSDAFMGSDLSYEDLSSRVLDNNKYERLEDQILDGKDHFVIEISPKRKVSSAYEKHLSWVDKKTFNIVKEISYDLKGKIYKEKEFVYTQIKKYDLIKEVYVKNIQKNHSTRIKFTDIMLNQNLGEDLFKEKNLKHIPFD